MSSVADHIIFPVINPFPKLWEFTEPVPARLVWDEDDGNAVVIAGGRYNQVVGCAIAKDKKLRERYSCRGLDEDDIRGLLVKFAGRITHQNGFLGVVVYHFDGVISTKIGNRRTVFNFDSLQILYEGYSEVLMHSDALYSKDVGAISHRAPVAG